MTGKRLPRVVPPFGQRLTRRLPSTSSCSTSLVATRCLGHFAIPTFCRRSGKLDQCRRQVQRFLAICHRGIVCGQFGSLLPRFFQCLLIPGNGDTLIMTFFKLSRERKWLSS